MAHICENYPCHKNSNPNFNCKYCYCPLFDKKCKIVGGNPIFPYSKTEKIKDCSECDLPHSLNFENVLRSLKENDII